MLFSSIAKILRAFVGLFGIKNRQSETLTIHLPVKFTRDTLYTLAGTLFTGLNRRPGKVVFDFTKLEQIQVGGITMLSNMIEFCKHDGVRIFVRNAEGCKAADFLRGSGLLKQYLPAQSEIKAGNVFLPLQLVEYARSFSHVHHQLIPWLSKVLGHDERALASLKVCFEEVFNNIRDHSSVNVGCSASHYDAAEEKITICISDFGVGIPGRVRHAMEIGTDQAAIAMACQEGFTTRSTPKNMGAGLHVLIRNVVAVNRGSIIIYSGEGIYSCTAQGPSVMKSTKRAAPGRYPGTMIYITLKKPEFKPDDIDEEEFQWE